MARANQGVAQFIYLSILLHAIAILLFGAPPGGSREGRAMWSSIDVRLVGARRADPDSRADARDRGGRVAEART